MTPYPLTLRAMLERACSYFADTEIAGPERRSTYGELARRARALAAGLRAAGLQPGERVATLLWNRVEHLEALFGVPLAGGVVHPLNPRLPPRQLAAIVADAGDRFVLAEEGLTELWAQVAAEGAAAAGVRVIAGGEAWEALLAAGGAADGLAVDDENAGAAMGYTSGTTGEPKGVVYSHRALALHALATALPDAMGLRASDCVLPLVGYFHANAWGIPYTATMLGCKQVLSGARFDPLGALELLEREQVTFSAGVPVIWAGVLDALEREPGRWRLHPELRVNLGGAPASEALMRRFDRQGIAAHMGWGMTEMTPVGAMNPHFGPDAAGSHARRTRQGRPLPFVEARTAPDGELEVRGAWVADRYFGGGHAEAFTADGWLRTGDVVAFDDGGLMEIVDRHKDLIRSGGEWISSVALENALAGHAGIRQAAVIAVPDPKWQERPLALIVLQPGAAAEAGEWRAHLREAGFAAWQCPDRFVAVEALPLTATGKLDKRALRAKYAAEAGTEPGVAAAAGGGAAG